VQVIGEEDLEQFMARMQQHVDRSKHNLNSLFEEVISSVEKDCTFRPSLEPTRAVRPPPAACVHRSELSCDAQWSLRPHADSGCFRLMRLFCTKGRRLWVSRAALSRLRCLLLVHSRPHSSLSVTLTSGPSTLGQQTFVHDSPGDAPSPAHGGLSRLWCHFQ
jgi:hypothetical protein